MISMITPEKLKDPHINPDADHLADAMCYWMTMISNAKCNYHPVELHSYACECKHCEITIYTNIKRLNCEYCGSSDPEVFTCTMLGK